MILLHILTNSQSQAIEIADYLIDNKMILEAVIVEQVAIRKKNSSGQNEMVKQVLVMGKTKALLFNDIDLELRKKYPDNMPVIYSIAIVNMDWEQSKLLIDNTAKV